MQLKFSGLMPVAMTNIRGNFCCKKMSMKEVTSVGMQTQILSCAGAQALACKNEYSCCRGL